MGDHRSPRQRRRIRTVAVPIWVKQGIDAWMTAAKIEDGRLLRPVSKSGNILRDELGVVFHNLRRILFTLNVVYLA
jgi:hypothetical protein